MLTLYHAPKSRSLRILWLLEEIGEPYEMELVSIRRIDGGAPPPESYRAIHPHLKVPALTHNGVTFFETGAIALYLTDLFPKSGMGPQLGDLKRGPYLTWLFYYAGVLQPSTMAKMTGTKHIYGAMGWGPAEEVEAYIKKSIEAGPYLLGEKFSAADIVIGLSMPVLMERGMFTKTPALESYVARIMDRPAFARARAKENG